MTTSNQNYKEAYVWIWLPGKTEPVVAGKLEVDGEYITFNYGKSYLERKDAISIYEPELPLQSGILPLLNGLNMPNSIRDAAPDAWGRRVIINRKMGLKGINVDTSNLDEMTYLLESGSDRIGSLDFQLSPKEYIPRRAQNATLEELLESAKRVENGIPLSADLDQALYHGSSIGGARPKALIAHNDLKYIAKFSASNDTYSVVKAEYIAMRLAALCGLTVAPVKLVQASKKDVILIERFDRVKTELGWTRKSMVSALTLFGLSEMTARYASYEELAQIIRYKFKEPKKTLKELFSRLVFNILCGNNDDHARNHAAFWDGKDLTLTPAYDICPQMRTGNETTQAMKIIDNNGYSQLKTCLMAAHIFSLSQKEAIEIFDNFKNIIQTNWDNICDEAQLTKVDKSFFWGRQFLNPFSIEY
jgi:serine/threonine-protein kinase HipA